jgi:dinuclear metal center YbgI/SA1388 family protein
MLVKDVVKTIDKWAAAGAALSFDNVGLLVGDPEATVLRGIVALDCTPAVVDECVRRGADILVTHHPLIFKPLKALTPETHSGAMALALARAGIALVSAHTNLDSIVGGVSFALAEQLGLGRVKILDPHRSSLYKLITFVPLEHFEDVRESLAEAGAGRIGEYEACAFTVEGTGYYRPGENANPFVGEAGGGLESAREIRLEVEVERWAAHRVLTALKQAHPYEEVAYDLVPVEQPATRYGLGAVGSLDEPMEQHAFLDRVARALGSECLRYSGESGTRIERVAVCGGSGSDLIRKAVAAGAQAFVTADITYHKFFDALSPSGTPDILMVDAGHYETEAITEHLLVAHLSKMLPAAEWMKTENRTSPVRTFVAGANPR